MAIGASPDGDAETEDATSANINMTGLDQLKNEKSTALLDTIDHLMRLQISDLISLP